MMTEYPKCPIMLCFKGIFQYFQSKVYLNRTQLKALQATLMPRKDYFILSTTMKNLSESINTQVNAQTTRLN